MLRVASKIMKRSVVARVPGLPFPGDVFSAVTASFVISHVSDYRAFLADVLRCLRPGAAAGFTAWGNNDNEFRRAWEQIACEYIPQGETTSAIREVIPWEEFFSDPYNLKEASRIAGFEGSG
jgi:ubiquinone/menaquinone biosynthesis C-methylase UbiE